ncbi:MAG: exopolyphosphatase / guanosine-5-triphosphate,3-diphosphate pyrophosphatase [Gaiellaceae bacterium]|jgi:exopolyphosphatase/guanosine-5'-triphosphate,3'-diphosphate pyrophosphatase|nr:exopolyphosphatase / guanosine-5-triphosphate,3-diphosphate pyrophosphatase [Gaiellaceae bacterium]
MNRVAAVDLGTNSTRLLVADVDDGKVTDVARESRITRLGEAVDERRRLLPVPIARARNVLSDFRRTAESLGAERTLAIATSAVRDAENGEAFLGEVEWSYGFTTRLLSGHEEAMLMFRGVTSERKLDGGTTIIDIGGGSTELVAGGPDGVRWHESLDIGSVRITERFLASDPPSAAELAAASTAVRALLAERIPDEIRSDTRSAVGVAGTITSIAGLALGLDEYDRDRIHGFHLSVAALGAQLERLASVPVAERRTLRPLDPDRAPVIVGGALIARELLAYFSLDELEVSERDILDGAALAAAELPEEEEGAAPPGAYTCC